MFAPPDDWSIVSKIAVAAMSSQGTMGGLLVGGLVSVLSHSIVAEKFLDIFSRLTDKI
jgi:hypothetical protein